jgi:hypothetical protein
MAKPTPTPIQCLKGRNRYRHRILKRTLAAIRREAKAIGVPVDDEVVRFIGQIFRHAFVDDVNRNRSRTGVQS